MAILESHDVWIHFNIYTGQLEKMDRVIETQLLPLVNQLSKYIEVKKWFFIRYIDQNGPHLRFRVKVLKKDWKKAIEFVNDKKPSIISYIKNLSHVKTRRLIPLKRKSPFMQTYVDVKLGLYDPEVKKYGGVEGMKYGESLFYISSKIVGEYISSINEQKIDRFELALVFMQELIEVAGLSLRDAHQFMSRYLMYWSGNPAKQNLASEFLAQASHKKEYVNQVLKNGESHVKNDYFHLYRDTFKELIELVDHSEVIQQTKLNVLFHYLHMMNNRLGVWPIEEAYLSALLLVHLESINHTLVNSSPPSFV